MRSFYNMNDTPKSKTTRDAILDATDILLARYGYKDMTIDDLAQEVGIGKGSIYLHFSSKEEIALSHIDRIIEHLITELRAIAEKPIPVNDRLREMLIGRVLYRFDSVQHYSKSLNELLTYIRPKLLDHRRKHFDDEARVFATVVSEGQAKGKIIDGDPFDLARTLVFATNSLLPYNLSTFEIEDRGVVEERTKKTADLLIRGLKV